MHLLLDEWIIGEKSTHTLHLCEGHRLTSRNYRDIRNINARWNVLCTAKRVHGYTYYILHIRQSNSILYTIRHSERAKRMMTTKQSRRLRGSYREHREKHAHNCVSRDFIPMKQSFDILHLIKMACVFGVKKPARSPNSCERVKRDRHNSFCTYWILISTNCDEQYVLAIARYVNRHNSDITSENLH